MPHLRFRATPAEVVRSLSASLAPELAQIMKTEESNFTFEFDSSQFYEQGTLVKGFPIVEIHWFSRSQEIQDSSAKVITNELRKYFPDQDIVVIFKELAKVSYYENGTHF